MSKPLVLAREIRLYCDRTLSPAALSANLAAVAIRERKDLIASGQAAPVYTTSVDGRLGAAESSVRPDGAIIYRFVILAQAAQVALRLCVQRSPIRTGAYAKSWVVIVNGKAWAGDLNEIPADSSVMIVNPRPYARRLDARSGTRAPPGIVEGVRQAVMKQFPSLQVTRDYVSIPAGAVSATYPVPYILHNRAKDKRSDRQAGQPISYPALLLAEK